MLRRDFLLFSAVAAAQTKGKKEEFTATATQDTTPRVGLALSSFAGGEEHDGSKIKGLANPQPVGAALSAADFEALVGMALMLGGPRVGDLSKIIGADEWVVVKLDGAGSLRTAEAVAASLAGRKLGARFTFCAAEAGGEAHAAAVAGLRKRFKDLEFEYVDLTGAETVNAKPPNRVLSTKNQAGTYRLPKIVQQCDKVISVAGLGKWPGSPLSIGNYRTLVPKDAELLAADPEAALIDVFSLHPADLAVVGPAVGGNAMVAGASALAVDAVAAAIYGVKPEGVPHFRLAEKRGFGIFDTDLIWIRGNEVEECRGAVKGL